MVKFEGRMLFPFGCISASLCLTESSSGAVTRILGARTTERVPSDSGNAASFPCNHSVSSRERSGRESRNGGGSAV